MNIPNFGSESQGPERHPGQEGDPRPEISPSLLRGAAGPPDVTAAYIPKNALSPAGAAWATRMPSRRRFDFLDPPRAPGELGWLAHYRVRRLSVRAAWASSSRPKTPTCSGRRLEGHSAGARRHPPGRATVHARGAGHGGPQARPHRHDLSGRPAARRPFLAMEYLQGMSLDRWLERGHKPSVDLVLRIGREIAAGLAAAHRRGLIHRDIKPANIWLEAPRPGQDPRLRAGPNPEPRRADHESRDDRRHAGLHGPGAGARRTG